MVAFEEWGSAALASFGLLSGLALGFGYKGLSGRPRQKKHVNDWRGWVRLGGAHSA